MNKIILPINKSETIPVALFKNNIRNIEFIYYIDNSQLSTILAALGVELTEGETEYLFIIEELGVRSFNFLVKKYNLICGVIENEISAGLARQHNNARVLIFNNFSLSDIAIAKCISIFLNEKFEKGRHLERIKQMKGNIQC